MTNLISLVFNFTITWLKITDKHKHTQTYTCTNMLTHKSSFGWPVFLAPLTIHGQGWLTGVSFVWSVHCSSCAKVLQNLTNYWAAPSSALPCFYKGSKLSLTLHPSCDGLWVHSDGSHSIFPCLSWVILWHLTLLPFSKITTVKQD